MNKDYSKSRFKTLIRISPEQKDYIKSIKGKYTLAGRLDEIINHIKVCTKYKPRKSNDNK